MSLSSKNRDVWVNFLTPILFTECVEKQTFFRFGRRAFFRTFPTFAFEEGISHLWVYNVLGG
ncbi:MAG: hypothetical protein A3H42_03030 [Deltaproteobacteria bacterium RIFCSPLOWO2_02_FULL_46_8]|nr:MAG: hypothetical protein A3H42_03030 [Deltaproteobacteria bacterium RIFCSPLOWO2_02_FULL_46_8]